MKPFITHTLSGVALTAITLGAPFAAFAQTSSTSTLPKGKDANFCIAIQSADFNAYAKFGGKFKEKIEDKEDKKDEKRAERDLKIKEKRAMINLKLGDRKEKEDSKIEDRFEKAEDKPMTDAQKQTLAEVQAKIQLAVDTKNGDFEALIKEYRADMDTLRAEHRAEIDAAITASKVEIDAAIAKAKADCAAGVPSETVKAQFQTSIKAIHEKFRADRSVISASTSGQLQAAIEARKEARAEVSSTFRATIKSAWQSFISLFGKRGE